MMSLGACVLDFLKMLKRKEITLAIVLHFFFLSSTCFTGINHSHVHSLLRSVQPCAQVGNWLNFKVLVLSLALATWSTPTIKCISEECKSSCTGVKHNWVGQRAGERYQNREPQTEIIMNLRVKAFCGHGSKNCAIRDGMWRPANVRNYYAPRKQEVFALCVYGYERKGTKKSWLMWQPIHAAAPNLLPCVI